MNKIQTNDTQHDEQAQDWEQWKGEHTATMEAGNVDAPLHTAAIGLLAFAEDANAFVDFCNSDAPGADYAAIMAALDICRVACDEIERQAREMVARDVRYHRAKLARFEAAGLLTIADEVGE